MDLIYKRTNTAHLKILAYKSQESPGKGTSYACFKWNTEFIFAPDFVAYSIPHTSLASASLKPLILVVQESMAPSEFFRSQSFF